VLKLLNQSNLAGLLEPVLHSKTMGKSYSLKIKLLKRLLLFLRILLVYGLLVMQDIQPFQDPVINLEQYPTSAHIAARLLFTVSTWFT
jgi:hypothetical protein